jgi:hypothetical protein
MQGKTGMKFEFWPSSSTPALEPKKQCDVTSCGDVKSAHEQLIGAIRTSSGDTKVYFVC